MSKIAFTPNANGSGVFTLASPNSNTNRTITLPDESVTLGAGTPSIDDNGNATAITITSDEEVLIGKTTDAQQTAGTTLYQNGQIYSTVNDSQSLVLTRKTNDGALALLYKDTNEVGRIFSGHGGTQVGIGSNTTGITFNPATRSVMPANPSSTSPQLDATLDLGFSSVRWRDLYLSGGVYLGGTGAANKLDDYEEGTFTPAFVSGTFSYGIRTGWYTKVGDLVTCGFLIIWSSKSGSGTINITLPFTTSSGAHYRYAGSTGYMSGVDIGSSYKDFTFTTTPSTANVALVLNGDNIAGAGAQVADMSGSGEIQGSLSFKV